MGDIYALNFMFQLLMYTYNALIVLYSYICHSEIAKSEESDFVA
jgi:hypothetical protein